VWDIVEDVEEIFEDETTTQGKLDFDPMQSQVWRVDGIAKSDVLLVDVGKFYDKKLLHCILYISR
jgi:hypothetical protein